MNDNISLQDLRNRSPLLHRSRLDPEEVGEINHEHWRQEKGETVTEAYESIDESGCSLFVPFCWYFCSDSFVEFLVRLVIARG